MAVNIELTKSADGPKVFRVINWKADRQRLLKYFRNKL